MQVWNVLHTARWKYRMQKIAISAPSHNFVELYLRNYGMYQQSEKKLVKQQCLLHMSWYYGELWPTSGWDWFTSLGHPSKFQRVSRLGSVTAWHSSSGVNQTAALNRGRDLYLAGRPSRWALAHILVFLCIYLHCLRKTSHLWLAITLRTWIDFDIVWQKCYR